MEQCVLVFLVDVLYLIMLLEEMQIEEDVLKFVDFLLNMIMLVDIKLVYDRAYQKDGGRYQLDDLDTCAAYDQYGAGAGVGDQGKGLGVILDITLLIRRQQQLIDNSKVILRKIADRHRHDQYGGRQPISVLGGYHRIHYRKDRDINQQNQRQPSEKAISRSEDLAHFPVIPVGKGFIQRRFYDSAHAELQKRNDLQKLLDRRYQSVRFRAVVLKDKSGQYKAAYDRDHLKRKRRKRISNKPDFSFVLHVTLIISLSHYVSFLDRFSSYSYGAFLDYRTG